MTDEQNESEFDDFASAAGAALRRPAPAGGLDGVRASRQRQRTTQAVAVTGVLAMVLAAGALIIRQARDNPDQVVSSATPVVTDPESTVPMTTTTAPAGNAPLQLTPDTPMLWADGVFVGALQGLFVAASETTGVPTEMIGVSTDLVDRTSGSSTWIPEIDECGITRLRSVDDDRRFEQGYLYSPDYPFVGTLDGSSPANDAALDAALADLGLDPASVDRLVPSADLDGDPDGEAVIVRYDADTPPTDSRSAVWLAVWDPATASITTLAGDPIANTTHFTAFGDGIADLDGNGLYDTVVDDGSAVTVFELTTGNVLSRVDTSCGNAPTGPSTSSTSSTPVLPATTPVTESTAAPGDTDRLGSWPAAPSEPLALADGLQFLPTAPVGSAGVPVRGDAEGRTVPLTLYTQVFSDAAQDIVFTIQTQPGGVETTPVDMRRPVAIDGWDEAFFTTGDLRLVATDPGGFVRLSGRGLTDDAAAAILETMQRRASGLPGWDLPADSSGLVEINGAWNESAAQRFATWFVGDRAIAQMITSPAHTDLVSQALDGPFEMVDVNGATGWLTTTPGTRRSIVWSPDGTTIVVIGAVDDGIDLLAVARSVTARSTADYEAQTTTVIPPGVGDGCDGSLFC